MIESSSVTRQQADSIAQKVIHHAKPEADYVILQDQTLERDFGWVYSYVPRRYLETRDVNYLVPGAGPLIVLRQDGSTLFLPTSVDTNTAITTFEQHWRTLHHPQ